MDVEQVKLIEFSHFSHAGGESQIVRGKLEKRVAGDGNFVIINAFVAAAEPEWLRIRDEVDFVAEGGEFDA